MHEARDARLSISYSHFLPLQLQVMGRNSDAWFGPASARAPGGPTTLLTYKGPEPTTCEESSKQRSYLGPSDHRHRRHHWASSNPFTVGPPTPTNGPARKPPVVSWLRVSQVFFACAKSRAPQALAAAPLPRTDGHPPLGAAVPPGGLRHVRRARAGARGARGRFADRVRRPLPRHDPAPAHPRPRPRVRVPHALVPPTGLLVSPRRGLRP